MVTATLPESREHLAYRIAFSKLAMFQAPPGVGQQNPPLRAAFTPAGFVADTVAAVQCRRYIVHQSDLVGTDTGFQENQVACETNGGNPGGAGFG